MAAAHVVGVWPFALITLFLARQVGQYSTVQYRVQYSTLHYDTPKWLFLARQVGQYSTVQITVQYITLQYTQAALPRVPGRTLQYITEYSTVHYTTVHPSGPSSRARSNSGSGLVGEEDRVTWRDARHGAHAHPHPHPPNTHTYPRCAHV